jgi:heat-inducible transcriptional repressor
VAPHTSSGRVPTDKGYRMFVDHLADIRPLTSAQRQAIDQFLGASVDLDDVLARTVRLLSQLTHQVALVQYPLLSRSRVRHIELVPLSTSRIMSVLITDTGRVEQRFVDVPAPIDETFLADVRARLNTTLGGLGLADATESLATFPDQFERTRHPLVTLIASSLTEQIGANRQDKLVLAGTANLVRTEEDFSGSIYPVLEAIEEQVTLLRLFGEMAADQSGLSVTGGGAAYDNVRASIGRENAEFGLGEISVLTSGYGANDGSVGRLGVLGPLRMDYSNNMAAVRAVARYLTALLGEE